MAIEKTSKTDLLSYVYLNEKSRLAIEKSVGLSFESIKTMDAEEIDKHIENKIGKKLEIDKKGGRFFGRGSVYLYLGRLLDIYIIDKILSKI
jgi:hypothetical protein